MRAPANPPAKPLGRLALTFVALLLATLAMTIPAKADEPSDAGADGEAAVVAEFADGVPGVESDGAAAAADAAISESADAPTLASYLSAGMLRVSADVQLVDGGEAIEPVVGSFAVDGLTYAIMEEGEVALVAVPPRTLAGGLVGGSAGSSDSEDVGEPATLALPDAVSYDGTGYSLTAIGPRALAGCDAATVVIPASVASVDQAAFEGSSVASVEVADGNPHLSSYDGMLFDADLTCLLLVPEGKQGAARIPKEAEVVDPSCFSHSAGVDAISVEAGSAAFSSRNGCLYDASGQMLAWSPPVADGGDLPVASFGEAQAHAGAMDFTLAAQEGVTLYKTNSAGSTLTMVPTPHTISCSDRSHVTNVQWISTTSNGFVLKLWHSGTPEYFLWHKPGHILTGVKVANLDMAYYPSGEHPTETITAGTEKSSGTFKGCKRLVEPLWGEVSYTISLKGEGGSPANQLVAGVRYGRAMPALPELPKREGYVFLGYYASSGGEEVRYYDETGKSTRSWDKFITRPESVSTNISYVTWVLHAKWREAVTVTLHSNAGGAAQIQLADGSLVDSYTWHGVNAWGLAALGEVWLSFSGVEGKKLATIPSRPGYGFLGWTTNPSATEPNVANGATSLEAWAVWGRSSVTFHSNARGTACLRLADGSLVDERTWSDVRDWGISGNTVWLDLGGAGGTLEATVEGRPGYEFRGWATRPDETAPDLTSSDEICDAWAVWGRSSVTFHSNARGTACLRLADGSLVDERTWSDVRDWGISGNTVWLDLGGAGGTLEATVEGRPGYEFRGWATRPDETAPDLTSSDEICDAWAVWAAGRYTVSFDANGGSGGQSEAVTATYDSAMPAISATNPARPGYAFEGWWDAATGGTRYYTAEGAGERAWDKASDATLYARWRAIGYAISYECAGGELPEDARSSYTAEDGFDLPTPTRYGYQFDGWDVSGVAEGGAPGPVLGAGVEDATAEDGSKVTRVKAGTYGDLSCTAKWTLRYDLDVPVCDPGSVTFEADSLTGQVRVAPGTSAEGAILSYMAVPVALDSLSCEGLDSSGAVDASGGAPELEAIFGAGSASKVRFTATLGEGDASQTARLTAGGASGTASLAGLSIPAATSKADPGRLAVAYGLELDPDLPIPPVRDAAPVARLAYTVSLPAAGA